MENVTQELFLLVFSLFSLQFHFLCFFFQIYILLCTDSKIKNVKNDKKQLKEKMRNVVNCYIEIGFKCH